jgi:hypothetical protein
MDDPSAVSKLKRTFGVVLFAALTLALATLALRERTRVPQAAAEGTVLGNSDVTSGPRWLPRRPHPSFREPSPTPAEPVYAGPGPNDPAGPGMLPHPITREHIRMYRDVELLDAAWQALKRRDFEKARVLLREHASEYASGPDDLRDGLTLLADCMQHPSPEGRARAQRFYDEQTASTARRRIRRYCLEAL